MSVPSLGGTTNQLPFNNRSLGTHNSLASAIYGLKGPLRADLSGHPSWQCVSDILGLHSVEIETLSDAYQLQGDHVND